MSRLLLVIISSLEGASAFSLLNLLVKSSASDGAAPGRDISVKQEVDLLQSLPGGLGVAEKGVQSHGDTECTKDHVRLPLDVGEGGGNEEGQGEVEAICVSICMLRLSSSDLQPVAGSRQTNALGTILKGENLTGVDPRNGGPGEAVDSDKDVGQGNNGLGRLPLDSPLENFVAFILCQLLTYRAYKQLTINAVDRVAVDSHNSSAGEVKNTTDDSTNDEKPSTAEAVDEGQDDTGCHEEDDILDDGGCQGNVASLFIG